MKRPSGPRPADTERTPTHTYRFPRAQEPPGRHPLTFPVFHLVARTPSTRRRITRAARVRKPSAENRSHIQKFSFPRSSSCVAYPRHTTHIRAFSKTIATYRSYTSCVCVFSISPFRVHGATELRTLHLNFPDSLSRFHLFRWGRGLHVRVFGKN